MVAPLPLTIPLFIFSIIGLFGNIKFIVINRKDDNLHKRLLLFLVALQTPLCLCIFVDVLRDYCGIPLTRQSCLRFVGAIYATFVVAMAVLYCCISVEMIVLVAKPLLFSRLKVWWFHLPVYIVTLAHFYPIYKSWISTENHSVTISPMAIDPNERLFGKWLLMASSIIMFIEDLIFLVILLVKKSILQDSFKLRLRIPSFIIANQHPIQHVFGRDKCADWSISDEFDEFY
ncbi:hypothetical protein PRIPAC_84120, partial [Pristionchus pacificus]|uniref:G protein-coupled receptor n=1 Tax=Pristionchus pacificus TaxID=54126 RepID=A0A2A6BTA5_PRIPA